MDQKPMFRKRFRYLCLFVILFSTITYSQSISSTVAGNVTAESDGVPLLGVNVIEQGTTNGEYSIEVSPEAVLIFSFLSFGKEILKLHLSVFLY